MTDPDKLKKDYESFLSLGTSKSQDLKITPSCIDKKILAHIKNDLTPAHKIVFIKLVAIQSFIGFLSLLFCPQFKLSLTNNHEVFHYFHNSFGEHICMMICGSIFIGGGSIFAAYILKSAEITKIKETPFLYYFSLSSIALSSFMIIGVEIYLNLATFWFLGASLGGMLVFQINYFLRRMVFKY